MTSYVSTVFTCLYHLWKDLTGFLAISVILGLLFIIMHKGEVEVPEALSTTVIISAVIGGIK